MLLLGEDRSAGKVLRGVGKDADGTSKKLHGLGKASAALAAGGLLVAGAAAVKFAKAAAEDEIGATQLARTLRSAAGASKAQTAATEDWITAQGKALGIADDDLRPALIKLVSATHDVGKAQKLASLAMDVSAARGVSLQTVSLALAKAQNGQIGGLGRLGIATKNADGKTKSLAQVTSDLTKLYSGAAATAADTTAGKQRRLTVALHEGQEEIGYKLLPAMLALTTAATDTIDWMEKHEKLVKSLAIGVGGLAAAVITVNTVTRAYSATQAAAATITGLFTKKTAEAETTTLSMGKAMRGAAGIGGAILLTKGLQGVNKEASNTDTALSGLEVAAGAAAVGFAVGGPLGAAIGGTGGALYGMVKTFGLFGTAAKQASGDIKLSKQVLDSYRGSLAGVSAAITQNTRELVLQHLQQSGMLDSTRKLGISDRDAVLAMTGNTRARKELAHALQTTTALTVKQKDQLQLETGAVGASRLAQLKHNIAIAGSAQELRRAKDALAAFMHAPASKRVSITGVESAKAKINALRSSLLQLWDVKIPGPKTTTDPLLGPLGLTHNAVGSVSYAGGWTTINENGQEYASIPRGSKILSSTKAQQAMSRSSVSPTAPPITININGVGFDKRHVARELVDILKSAGVTTGSVVLA
jgi:hypothetical protein